jgi:hypothetical protein
MGSENIETTHFCEERSNGVNPTKKDKYYAALKGDQNDPVEDEQLDEFQLFNQLKDKVLDFTTHAL